MKKKIMSLVLAAAMVMSLGAGISAGAAATEPVLDISSMSVSELAHMDTKTASPALKDAILAARCAIVYAPDAGWSVDGTAAVTHADGTVEVLPKFSDLYPDWDLAEISRYFEAHGDELSFGAVTSETAAHKTSSWARETVDRAIAMGLVSASLPGEAGDFTTPITKDDFCTLALNYLALANNDTYCFRSLIDRYKVNKRPDGQADNPFTDRNTAYTEYGAGDVTMCYYLGIVKGSTDGRFGYGRTITRQEVAAMLFRAYEVCGGELPAEPAELTFHDQASIQHWARDDVAALLEWQVMTGDDKGNFVPDGLCTYEQAVAMFLRLYDNAPVRIANGNVKQLFTYEQCMEYLLSLNGTYYVRKDATVEGPYATYVRMDEGNMGRITRILFVYRRGGVRVADPGINTGAFGGIPANSTIENTRFSLDGRTFSCDIHALIFGTEGKYSSYHVDVDLDTLACQVSRLEESQQ